MRHRLFRHAAVRAALLVVLTLAAYAPAMRAGYIWDDEYLIIDSPDMRSAAGLFRIWFTTQRHDYYPVTWSFFWCERHLWGTSPAGYHVVNILLHAAGALLVWRVLARLAIPGAWLAAVLFAVHPVTVASVAWIAEGKNTLALVFYALASLLYLQADEVSTGSARRRRVAYGLALASFVLALLSKTSGVLLPVAWLGCAWWQRGRVRRSDVARALPFLALAGTFSLVGIWFQTHRAIGDTIVRPEGLGSRLAGVGWAAWFYLYKALVPIHLSMVYPRWAIDPTAPLSWVPLAALVGGIGLSWACRHRCGRGPLFAWLYILATLFPVLGFFDMAYMRFSLVADHFQYLALIGTVTVAVAGATWALRDHGVPARRLGVAAAAALVLTLSLLTFRQSRIYETPETFWRATLAENPRAVVAHGNLGIALADAGRFDDAIAQYRQGLALQPDDAGLHKDIGGALAMQEHFAEAISEYREALRLKPRFPEVHSNLGLALARLGDDAAARAEYEAALRGDPDLVEAHNNLGALLQRAGDIRGAESQYRQALALKPEHAEAHVNLGNLRLAAGDLEAAIASYRAALRNQPKHAAAHQHLGLALARSGSMQEAIGEYRAALALTPDDPAVLNELAWFLATHPDERYRDGAEAVSLAQRACERTNRDNAFFLDTLAAAYAEAGRFAEAVSTEADALKIEGQDAARVAAMRQRQQLYARGMGYRDPPAR